MSRENFKVIIVGGGLAGLTLANALEKLHIDYVLFEAYSDISPRIGACIALMGNSMRILDQLGCYEEFAGGPDRLEVFSLRAKAQQLIQSPCFADNVEKRLGYVTCFGDRAHLLNTLYENLKDKSKVLLNKRVIRIESDENGACVYTSDGEQHRGDVVAGVDGMHSIVRSEMWRLAEEEPAPTRLFPKNEIKDVLMNYRAAYGTTTPKNKLNVPSTMNFVFGDGLTYLTVLNRSGTHFWFIVEKLGKSMTMEDERRFTEKDAHNLAKKHLDDPILDGIKFGDIYPGSTSVGMTVFHEKIFSRWHYKRLITVGDSAHKINPNTGLGGGNAVESVAALVNVITELVDNKKSRPSQNEVEQALSHVRPNRIDRVTATYTNAQSRAKIEQRESPVWNALVPFIFKSLTLDAMFEPTTSLTIGACRINALPVPRKPRFIPFDDELPTKPASARVNSALWWASIAGFSGLGYAAKKMVTAQGSPSVLGLVWNGLRGTNLPAAVTQATPFTKVALSSKSQIYASVTVACAMAMWTLEKYRRGNRMVSFGKLLRLPGIFAAMLDVYGAKTVVPFYYIISSLRSGNAVSQRTPARPVESAGAKSIIPALGTSLAASQLASYMWRQASSTNDSPPTWKLAALLVAPISSLIYSYLKRTEKPNPDTSPLADMNNDDIPILSKVYSAIFSLSALTHAALITIPLLCGSSVALDTAKATLATPDLALLGSGIGMWTIYSILDARRAGYVTTQATVKATLLSMLSLPLLGPVATHAAVSRWRDTSIASLSIEKRA